MIADAISTGQQHVYPHIIRYLLRTIDSEKYGSLYNESTYEVTTYLQASRDDRRCG